MKTNSFKLACIMVLSISLLGLQAQTNKKGSTTASDTSALFLKIKGKFDKTVIDFNGIYTIKLIYNNKVVEEQTLKVSKPFAFHLSRNCFYAIRIEKDGYIPKIISISTIVPKSLGESESYTFTMSTNLLSNYLLGLFEDDSMDFPSAIIYYDKGNDSFELNQKYTDALINKMKSNLLVGL